MKVNNDPDHLTGYTGIQDGGGNTQGVTGISGHIGDYEETSSIGFKQIGNKPKKYRHKPTNITPKKKPRIKVKRSKR